MDVYNLSRNNSAAFDQTNRWQCVAPGRAFSFSSQSQQMVLFDDSNLEATADHVILISHNSDDHTIDAERAHIAHFIESSEMPKDAVTSMLKNTEICGLRTATSNEKICVWYSLPTLSFLEDFRTDHMYIYQVLDKETSRARIMIFCPSFLRREVAEGLQISFGSLYAQDSLGIRWPFVHLILAKCAISSFSNAHWAIQTLVGISLRGISVSVQAVLDNSLLLDCNSSLTILQLQIHEAAVLESIVEKVYKYLNEQLASNNDMCIKTSEIVPNLLADCEELLSSLNFLKDTLLVSRHTLTSSIEIRNANYIRLNTIALRRTAEQAQIETREAKKQSALSQQTAKSMAKIAYLTMFYLPSSFIATLFSMPFFQLDENLSFSAMSKFWIYIVVAMLSTIATFLVSASWDYFIHPPYLKRREAHIAEAAGENEEQDDRATADARVLEPVPFAPPGDNELIQQILNIRDRGVQRGRPDVNSDTTQEAGAELEEQGEEGEEVQGGEEVEEGQREG